MQQAKTHLGNPMLHSRHHVMIEGGMVPRAKVMDQTMIDRHLMRGEINLPQHQAGEYLLGQAVIAGVWATGINWQGAGVTGVRNFVPFGAFPFGRTLEMVERKYGRFHSLLIHRVVCDNWDVGADENLMKWLKQGLDWISNRRMGGGRNPMRRLRRAAGQRRAA